MSEKGKADGKSGNHMLLRSKEQMVKDWVPERGLTRPTAWGPLGRRLTKGGSKEAGKKQGRTSSVRGNVAKGK